MLPAKIMVVEDERIVALHLKQQLTKLGYEVVAMAASGEQALRSIAGNPPDLVLMDIRIEGDIDGIETAARIPSDLHIPIIYLTAYSEETTLSRASATRPYGYLLKPFSERDLHAAIQMALSRAEMEHALRASEERLALALEAAAMRSWELDPHTRRILRVGHRPGGNGLTAVLHEFFSDTWGSFLDRVHPDDRATVRALFDSGMESGSMTAAEFRSCDPGGAEMWLRVQGKRFESGRPLQRRVIGVIQDVTARRRAEERLRQAALVFETTQDGILVLGPDLTIRSVNRGYCRMTAYTPEELIGRKPGMLIAPDRPDEVFDGFLRSVVETGEWRGEIRGVTKDGGHFPVLLSVGAVRNDETRSHHYVAVFTDLTAVRRAEDQLQRLAHYDHLTGLPNRLLAQDRLDHAVQRCRRHDGRMALLLVDVDDFKSVNDTFGHNAGDEVLRVLAQRMRAAVREEDTVARLGGDEFLVILERVSGPDEAAGVARRIIEGVAEPTTVAGTEMSLTASVGISLCPQDFGQGSDLIRASDTAMYAAKAAGRRSYAFYTPEMTAAAMRLMAREQELRRAVERGEFVLHYQPQFTLPERRLVGVEALIRWEHPERGLLGPDEIIPAAERGGLIGAIGEWVLGQACRQWCDWQPIGAGPLRMAVNVSPQQLRNGHFLKAVDRVIAETGIPPACLELEITESMLQSDAGCLETLTALNQRGVTLAIDDFGTGYSNLGSLASMPIHRLKVDRAFIREVSRSTDAAALAEAIIAIAQRLNLAVLAEGVETDEQEAFLIGQGCPEAQGFLYSRPLPAEAVQDLIRRHT